MKLVIIFLLSFISFYAMSDDTINCIGHSKIDLKRGEVTTSIRGMYVFNISNKSSGYIALSGETYIGSDVYRIDRVFKVKVSSVSGMGDLFDIKIVKTTRQPTDNVPDSMSDNLMLNRSGIYKIQRTLGTSYLISDIYSPILICHMFVKPQ